MQAKTKEETVSMPCKSETRALALSGLRDAVPVGFGYLAVSFSLGIVCKNAGMNVWESALLSLLNNASAGEYAALTVIAARASLWEMALLTLIANARYLLMSCALSQRLRPDMPIYHRLIIGFDITDELFGLAINRPGMLEPPYYYGAMIMAMPMWALGTALGVLAGSVLPAALVSALSVALYAMFLAIIIPQARKDRVVRVLVPTCFALSLAFSRLPGLKTLSEGTRTIVLTIAVSAAAALLCPRKEARNA